MGQQNTYQGVEMVLTVYCVPYSTLEMFVLNQKCTI